MRRLITWTVTLLILGAAPSVEAALLVDGLKAHLTFSGNAVDSSGQGSHGTVYGATLTTDRFGNTNSAYSFDGVGDWIDIGNVVSRYDLMSLSAWVRLPAISPAGPQGIVSKQREADRTGARIGATGNVLNAGFNRHPVNVVAEELGATTDAQWHHLTGVIDLSRVILYIDGQFESETTFTPGSASSNLPMLIGKEFSSEGVGGRYFQGAIDDVRVYDRALTGQEVNTIFRLESANAVPEPASVAIWSLLCLVGFVIVRRRR